jgi:hypothetical protein
MTRVQLAVPQLLRLHDLKDGWDGRIVRQGSQAECIQTQPYSGTGHAEAFRRTRSSHACCRQYFRELPASYLHNVSLLFLTLSSLKLNEMVPRRMPLYVELATGASAMRKPGLSRAADAPVASGVLERSALEKVRRGKSIEAPKRS